MSDEYRAKLTTNIERSGWYPPLLVRPHPELDDEYQIFDGEMRYDVLRSTAATSAWCVVWECSDEDALILLATLNRLRGEDVPAKRAELLAELRELVSEEVLITLLPETTAAIDDLLALREVDAEALLEQLVEATESHGDRGPRLISFLVTPDDEEAIDDAVQHASSRLTGSNRRGRALGEICRSYVEREANG